MERGPFCECESQHMAPLTRVHEGDIVFARTGATTGESFTLTACPGPTVFASIPHPRQTALPQWIRGYLERLLRNPRLLEPDIEQLDGHGSARRERGETGLNPDGPGPSLADQRRIAAILDKADAIRRKRQQTLQLTDDLLRSAFLDMFGDPVTNPNGWRQARLDAVAEIRSGVTKGRRLDPAQRCLGAVHACGERSRWADLHRRREADRGSARARWTASGW